MSTQILTIAGSDPSGGAGIQADIRTITKLNCHANTVITAVTAQNTRAVYAIHPIPLTIITKQIYAVLEEKKITAIKTGMIIDNVMVQEIAKHIPDDMKLIVDPVLISSSEYMLSNAKDSLIKYLFPKAILVTPNIHEATVLAQQKISSIVEMEQAGKKILSFGANGVLLKGSHLNTEDNITDVLVTTRYTKHFIHRRVKTSNTHGTGCMLSAAITCLIAQNYSLNNAIEQGIQYVCSVLQEQHFFST